MVQKALADQGDNFRTLKDAKYAFERDYLISVLQLTKGQVANSARIAGRNRTEFYKLLSTHNLDPIDFRDPVDTA
jgi:two-component system response regulator GlrR